jgi:hypothetical protein
MTAAPSPCSARAAISSLPPAEQIGERAGRELEDREHERVAAQHPLEVGEGRAEVVGDRLERDVRGRNVDEEDRGRHADDRQGPALG